VNRETKKFEPILTKDEIARAGNPQLESAPIGTRAFRADGDPVPNHCPIFTVGELVVLKDSTFKIVYIGAQTLLLEPTDPMIITEIVRKP